MPGLVVIKACFQDHLLFSVNYELLLSQTWDGKYSMTTLESKAQHMMKLTGVYAQRQAAIFMLSKVGDTCSVARTSHTHFTNNFREIVRRSSCEKCLGKCGTK